MNASKLINSSQTDIHKDLITVVNKHWQSEFKKPYRPFSEQIFESINKVVCEETCPLILDSGCGNGNSTLKLADENPNHLVIGLDKSAARLKHYLHEQSIFRKDNLLIARTDLVDFYRQAAEANWQLDKHCLFYPNPWPKPEHLKRRWHGHPVFKSMLKLGGQIELRTNWRIYAEEFSAALSHLGQDPVFTRNFSPTETITPFEQKYLNSGHILYQLRCNTP